MLFLVYANKRCRNHYVIIPEIINAVRNVWSPHLCQCICSAVLGDTRIGVLKHSWEVRLTLVHKRLSSFLLGLI